MGTVDNPTAVGRASAESTLSQYGILGMKWGVRRTDAQLSRIRPPASEDYKVSRAALAKPKSALSNQEMQTLITRMNLERQYATTMAQINAKPPTFLKKSADFAVDLLLDIGKSELRRVSKAKGALLVEKEMLKYDPKVAERITPKPKKNKDKDKD